MELRHKNMKYVPRCAQYYTTGVDAIETAMPLKRIFIGLLIDTHAPDKD